MTGRERLTAILHGRPADRLAWTCLADENTLRALPPPLAGASFPEFCRHLGCDVLLLNGWGTGHAFASPAFSWGPGVTVEHAREGTRDVTTFTSPAGALTAAHARGHPVKYPVRSLAELRIYRRMWETACFEARDDTTAAAAIDALLGDDGITARFWGPSAVPRLLEYDMGIESFYLLLADHPREMADLLERMHQKELAAFGALADGPCEVVILCENTSTRYISPNVYRRFNGPHVKDFVDAMHAAGKIAIVHMCGHVRGLLEPIRQTHPDGVHALTAPPVGDTPWEAALDVLGEQALIIGAFCPDAFTRGPVEQIGRALDALYTPRLRRSNVILCCFADGLSVPLERFAAVADWFDRNG